MGIYGSSHKTEYVYVERGGNPNPKKFVIKSETFSERHTVVYVNYPDATNYEGDKVLVLTGTASVKGVKELDPHFSKGSRIIARFKPDAEGLGLAIKFVHMLEKTK
jgi:hypothetical protein